MSVALILAGLATAAGVAAVAIASSTAPTPPRATPPRADPPPPPTLPPVGEPAEHTQRLSRVPVTVPRSNTAEPWPLFVGQPLPAGIATVVRVSMSATWAPAAGRDGSAINVCGQWVHAGRATPGATLSQTVRCKPLGCPGKPAWLRVDVRVDLDNRVVVFVVYPGDEHTGIYRGIEYAAVVDVEAPAVL